MSKDKKDIPKEDLDQVLGGVKSQIMNEIDNRPEAAAAGHLKYSVDLYTKGGRSAQFDAPSPTGL